jgi:predicted Rossmann fold nucleotide-binding protein DprA/Smf involved in DNA uptake
MSSRYDPNPNIGYMLCTDEHYPAALSILGDRAPTSLALLGNADLLGESAVALFCSVKCPGSLILKTYDLSQKLRETNATVISGFHSPVERECLNVLCKSTNRMIICPARGLELMRIPADYRKLLEEGRLLLLSPFSEKQRQASAEMAERRNHLVAALASSVLVTYAAPRSKTENLCRRIVEWNKPLFTFSSGANNNLVEIGAKALDAEFAPLIGSVKLLASPHANALN